MSNSELIRTLGYGVSSISVALLGLVSWHSTHGNPAMRWTLIGGMTLSMLGMVLRWASHRAKKTPEE